MCLIIYAGKNTNKKDAFLEEAIRKAEEFNGDGMGFAVKKHNSNSIYLDKGYNDVDEFIKQIKAQKVGVRDELLIHLRIGNKGAKNSLMCHPFVVSNDDDEIIQLEASTDKMIIAHNGTMHRHSVINSLKSDTFYFTKNVMSKESVQKFLYDSPEDFDEVMQPHLNTSRLIIMKHDQKTILLGKWYQENGLYFSKDYYDEYFPKPIQNVFDWRKNKYSNDYGYDSDYDDYWNGYHYNAVNKEVEEEDDSESLEEMLNSFDNLDTIKIPALKHGVVCPLLDYDRPSFKDTFGFTYNYYLGLYLCEEQLSIKFIPAITQENLSRFLIIPKENNKAYSINKLCHYTISRCNNYSVTVYDYLDKEEIIMPNEEFYNTFKVSATTQWHDAYNDLYRLIININGSKTTYKRLSKVINTAIENSRDSLNFKNVRDVELDAAVLFMQFLKEELGYRKEPHTLMF